MNSIDKSIGKEWFEYGLKQSDNFFIKFMMYWVAFNWYYDFYTGDREWQRIRAFCNENISKLSKYNAFNSEHFKAFSKRAIMDGRTGRIEHIHKERYKQIIDNQSIPYLIETLYQVRCNLFHGSKSISSKRDIELVRASSHILEGYLKAYLGVIDTSGKSAEEL